MMISAVFRMCSACKMQTHIYLIVRVQQSEYHQTVYALYAELSFPAGKLFDAKIGGRYERTEINSFYSNAQQQMNCRV